MNKSIGERIVAERKRLNFQQGDICNWTGVGRSTQFGYERGERVPDASYLVKLIDHGFDIHYILTGTRSPRYGVIDANLLGNVFAHIEAALIAVGKTIDINKKAKLIAFIYQTAAENGQIDITIIKNAIGLLDD
ncbi:helix-turn-helix domain-containing protein [Robbsia andropogonis]|uniref:helix-turn-helix domain-containing protein n=1 Tax=Robbsia andropogonis TaxID=28092 RepID=UPI0015887606|nr:XRE family transcriptional regulator [Robbsia andropogonis]